MIELVIYRTVHGQIVPTVGAVFNPDVFGKLIIHDEMHRLAGKLGATDYEIRTGEDGALQGELFPRPKLELVR